METIAFRHERYCGCEGCNKTAKENIEECIRKGDWCAFIGYNENYPNSFFSRTYGFKNKYGHLDLQICLPLQEREVLKTFTILAEAIERGQTFKAGKEYYGIFESDVHMRLLNVTDKGEDLLRVLIPTNNDDFEYPAHKAQFTLTK